MSVVLHSTFGLDTRDTALTGHNRRGYWYATQKGRTMTWDSIDCRADISEGWH